MALVVAGLFSSVHPAFDAIANLRWHLSIGLLVLSFLALVSLRFRFCLFALVIGVVGLIMTVPLSNPVNKNAKGVEFSVLSFNMFYENPQKQKTIDMLIEQNADVMTLIETSREWTPYLLQLNEIWPYQKFCSSFKKVGGVTIFSKYPLIEGVGYCAEDGSFGIAAMEFEDEDIVLGAVHLDWPWPWNNSQQIDGMKEVLENIPKNAILAGDFNSASWTDNLSRFAQYGNLIHDRTLGGSWMLDFFPAYLAPYIGLRIDHVLHKGNLVLKELSILGPSGSDHLPLLAVFVIPAALENNAIPQQRPSQ